MLATHSLWGILSCWLYWLQIGIGILCICGFTRYTHTHPFVWIHFNSAFILQDPEGKPKKANIRDNRDGTYTVSYVPDMTGRYTITIKYGGDEIPYSPYRIHALPSGDASKCLVTGQLQTCYVCYICLWLATLLLSNLTSSFFSFIMTSNNYFCWFLVSIGGHGLGEFLWKSPL